MDTFSLTASELIFEVVLVHQCKQKPNVAGKKVFIVRKWAVIQKEKHISVTINTYCVIIDLRQVATFVSFLFKQAYQTCPGIIE